MISSRAESDNKRDLITISNPEKADSNKHDNNQNEIANRNSNSELYD